MKKKYLVPETSIIYLEFTDIITLSQTFGPDENDVPGNDIYNNFEE